MLLGAMGVAVSVFDASEARAQDKGLPRLFVAPLDGDVTQVLAWQPAVGEGLAEMLITELTKINKFDVLESTALEHLKDEIRLGEEGFVASDEKVARGGWAAADFMFRGKVTRFGGKSQGIGLGGFAPGGLGNLGIKTSKQDVRIDWRLVDVATRKIISSGSSNGEHSGVGFDIGVAVKGSGGGIGFDNQEFMNSGLGKATVKALSNLVSQVQRLNLPPSGRSQMKAQADQHEQAAAAAAQAEVKATPGKVLAAPAKHTVIISLGSQHGLKTGDKLKLFETVDTKDDQGNVVFTEEKPAGEITIETVQPDRSKASYHGDHAVKAGWVVRQ
jgi:curli biogenesis system outer membrane secretion channel CsgG